MTSLTPSAPRSAPAAHRSPQRSCDMFVLRAKNRVLADFGPRVGPGNVRRPFFCIGSTLPVLGAT